MHPQIAALALRHHGHNVSLWATAHGAQGQGPRILLLAIAAIICAVIISFVMPSKKKA